MMNHYKFYFRVIIKKETPRGIIDGLINRIHFKELEYFGLIKLEKFKDLSEFIMHNVNNYELRLIRILNNKEKILSFVDWIMPYIDAEPGDFLGFIEEDEQNVEIIKMKEGVALDISGLKPYNKNTDPTSSYHGDDEIIDEIMKNRKEQLSLEDRIKKIEESLDNINKKINSLIVSHAKTDFKHNQLNPGKIYYSKDNV